MVRPMNGARNEPMNRPMTPVARWAGHRRWVMATGNAGKVAEFQALLSPLGIELVTQANLGIPEADEPHVTFVENALAKARHASAHSGLPALADDSGLAVDALGGAPGVRSARYALDDSLDAGALETLRAAGRERIDEANNARLLRELRGSHDRRAQFCCVLALVQSPVDPLPVIAQGIWTGTIAASPAGVQGFGYDPLFVPEGAAESSAQMSRDAKNRVSHRARAVAALLAAVGTPA